VAYLPNYYGAMNDGRNAGEESDRLLLEWDLLAPRVVAACRGGGAAAPSGDIRTILALAPNGSPIAEQWDGGLAVLAIPEDIERLRLQAAGQAREWRLAVRRVLGDALAGGAVVVGFRQREGYVIGAPERRA
jgi:predicted GNAT superfamily acetyltransferase